MMCHVFTKSQSARRSPPKTLVSLLTRVLIASVAFTAVARTEARALASQDQDASVDSTLIDDHGALDPLFLNEVTPKLTERANEPAPAATDSDDRADPGEFPSFDEPPAPPSLSVDPSPWRKPDGSQKPLKDLDQAAIDGLWDEALKKGRAIVEMLDEYVPYGISRLNRVPEEVEEAFKENYESKVQFEARVEDDHEDINEPFKQIGSNIDGNSPDFQWIEVKSKIPVPKPNRFESVLDIAMNAKAGALISLVSYAENDGNPEDKKLRSSELTWQVWKSLSRVALGANIASLKYWLRHYIMNQETVNIMTLAHQKFPQNVDSIPLKRSGRPFEPEAGHGKWLPPKNPQDEPGNVFTRLLNTPNIRPIAHLLADHNDELVLTCIVEIHTFPERTMLMVRNSKLMRKAGMVAVLGKCDSQATAGAGVVETA